MMNLKYQLNELAIKILSFDYFVIKRVIDEYSGNFNYNNVLDIGSGTGSLSKLFNKKKYLGIDIDEGSTKYAKEVNIGYKYLTRDVTKFNLKKKFDLIIVIGVFHHLNKEEVLKSLILIKKHLNKNGGVIIIEAIKPISNWNLISVFLRSLDRGHFIRTKKEYENLIKRHFLIKLNEQKGGITFDYAAFLATHKNN